jgi:cell division protein FtsW
VAVLFGPRVNGATRWLGVGGSASSRRSWPSSPSVLFMAALLERRMDRINDAGYALLPIAAVLGAIVGLVLVQPDFGTAACLVMIAA